MRSLAAPILLLTAMSCASTTTGHLRFAVAPTSADTIAYRAYSGSGSGTVIGQAFLTTRGGDVKVAAGREVYLDPATDYAKACFDYVRDAGALYDPTPSAGLLLNDRRSTVADAQGRFKFSRLPAGKYFVSTRITWITGAPGNGLQGGVVMGTTIVTASDTAEVVVTRIL
jgi:hypothetical protein